jgi:hypothetical protein
LKNGQNKMKTKIRMNLMQANATIERADSLFRRAANAWVRGNNSGDSVAHSHGTAQCERFRDKAEELLTPLGIAVDYPGLYPSFTVHGFAYHTTESAVSAALEGSK